MLVVGTWHLQVGDSLEEFLLESTNDAKLRQLMMSMSEAIRTIAFKVTVVSVTLSCCCMVAALQHKFSCFHNMMVHSRKPAFTA